jgi:hypothetical protein
LLLSPRRLALLTAAASFSAAAVGAVGPLAACSCGSSASPAPPGATGGSTGSHAGAAGASGAAGKAGAAGQSGYAGNAGSAGKAGSAGASGPGVDGCFDVVPPPEVTDTYQVVHSLGCECTHWLSTNPADFPALSWEACPPGVLDGLGCERLHLEGEGPEWAPGAVVAPGAGGPPLLAMISTRNFYNPSKAAAHVRLLSAEPLAVKADLLSDVPSGHCLSAYPRLGAGRLLTWALLSKKDAAGQSKVTTAGFSLLSTDSAGAVSYLGSDAFPGDAAFTTTSDNVYGRFLSETKSGLFRAEGKDPAAHFVDTSPFGSAFPVASIGELFVLSLQGDLGVGFGVYHPSPAIGFQPLRPPLPGSDRAARSVGGDGATLVWTESQGRTGNNTYTTNDVFVAPHTTSAETLTQTAHRLTKAKGAAATIPWAVGCGYAAQRWDDWLQVVRLADGASVALPRNGAAVWLNPQALTCDSIYGILDDGNLGRIRFDKLPAFQPAE